MKNISPRSDWPDSWKSSYECDRQEIYSQITNAGYAYAYDNRRKKTLSLVAAAVPKHARILDIAAAQGNFSIALAEMGYRVTWNDLREELIGYVKLKHEYGELKFAAGNAFELIFQSQFDAVLITEIIEHVAHPDDFLLKTAELVKPGGFIFMTTFNGKYFRNKLPKFSECADPTIYESAQFKPGADGHIFLLYPEEIRILADRAGLLIDELLYFTNPLTNGHVKTSYLLRVMPRRMVDFVESLTQQLPKGVAEKLLVQVGVRFRKPLEV